MIRLTVDDREVLVEAGTTILEAAATSGIRIPTLCYHEKLQPFGACRICVVEVEQMKGRLIPSCSTPVTEGMVVRTRTEQILKARRTVLELLLIHHPLDCPICDKGGECQLQDLVYEFGITQNRFKDQKSNHPIDYVSPLVERNTNRCVLCGMCVRVCDEVVGASELSMVNRGIRTKITTDFDRPLDCEFCGECENICPVGALTNRQFKFKARAWEMQTISTVCSFCSTGCAIKLCVKNGQIARAVGEPEGGANRGSLCIKGRFGYEYVMSPERIKRPLVRRNGKLEEATWEEALQTAARGFKAIKEKDGPEAIAGFCSARLTNEEAYLFQKLLRTAMGTNNVDNSGGYAHRGYSPGLRESLGVSPAVPSVEDLRSSDAFLVIRSNVSETHPVVGYQVTAAVKQNDARLIVADPRRVKLSRLASVHLSHRPGTEIAILNGLARVILDEGLEDREFLAGSTEGLQGLKKSLEKYTPAFVEQATGIAGADLKQAARLFASGEKGVIIISAGMGFGGDDAALARCAANLAQITGNAGKPGAGVLFLGEKNNSHGVVDMGAEPDRLPGGQRIADDAVRQRFEKAWGAALSSKPGRAAEEILSGAEQGSIKALYCVGENPLQTYPDSRRTKKALGNIAFLVVQDLFLTPTAQMAQVVFPVTSFAEKEGTYTNCEHRIQRLRKALPPYGETKSDGEIICAVAKALGTDIGPPAPEKVMAEIAGLVPRYREVTYDKIPVKGIMLDGAGKNGNEQGKSEALPPRAQLIPVDFVAPPAPTAEYPYVLLTGPLLFHSGSLSPRSKGICVVCPEAFVEIGHKDARALDIKNGDTVAVTSAKGSITIGVRVTAKQNPGSVFIPYHFAQPPVHELTDGSQPQVVVKIEKRTP